MNSIVFCNTQKGKIDTALLIQQNALDKEALIQYYSPTESTIALPLLKEGKKTRAAVAKMYLENLLLELQKYPIKQLICANADYFRLLVKAKKITNLYGENLTCEFPGYEKYKVVYVPNYQALIYDPKKQDLITLGLNAIKAPLSISTRSIIHSASYGKCKKDSLKLLNSLHNHHSLSCDIETTGLILGSKLVSIGFAWDEHNGIAILTEDILPELREFFINYKGKLIFHRCSFDVKQLIWMLFMDHPNDYVGMQKGLDVFADVEDSQILTYLALNSTTDVALGLKENSIEFAGNYGIEITDASKIDPDELLEYNLKDVLSTWYVWNKYWDVCETDKQLGVYAEIFQPSLKIVLKMMLTGLSISLDRVAEVKNKLQTIQRTHEHAIFNSQQVKDFTVELRRQEMLKANKALKKKTKPFSAFSNISFNLGSPKQMASFLYDFLGYEVEDFTETGLPATGTDTVSNLLGISPKYDHIIKDIIEVNKVSKILNTFITAFEAYTIEDFLHGDLNLGGTQSGRLSSSNPNLQNLPSGSTYGELIKYCFVVPDGWLMWGIDYAALEERIGTIQSQDPNRIKIYTEGFCGHCIRAHKYFSDEMEGIDPTDPISTNSIKTKYPKLRRNSKAPSFALQYGGTAYTLEKKSGFPKEKALAIEAAYHDLYKVSDAFSKRVIEEAAKKGYAELAFGLRIRTPILKRTVLNSTHTPYIAKAEGRSVGNAVTQTWGMLINRALIATNRLVEQSQFCYDILFSNTIHDSAYGLVRDTPEAIKFLNDTIVKEFEWNDHPAIKSEEVPMCANLELGKSWDTQTEIPNYITLEEVKNINVL